MGVYEPEFIHKWTDEHGTEVEAFIGGSGHGVVYAGFDGLPPVGSTSTGLDPTVKELLRLASDLKAKDSENVSLRQRVQELEKIVEQAIWVGKLRLDGACIFNADPDGSDAARCADNPELTKFLGGKP